MKRLILGLTLLLMSLAAESDCVDPNQILYFTNSLLTRKCSWVDTIDLWRTTNTQYNVIFLGDSLIANGSWGTGVGNQGYGGDTVQLLLQRLDIVINAHPSHVYIMVGINDFYRGASSTYIFTMYSGMINMLKNAGIQVTVLSTLKCNQSMQPSVCVPSNTKIDDLNASLGNLTGITFVDLNSQLSNANGLLSQYTTDGIHLNAAGYAIVYQLIN